MHQSQIIQEKNTYQITFIHIAGVEVFVYLDSFCWETVNFVFVFQIQVASTVRSEFGGVARFLFDTFKLG